MGINFGTTPAPATPVIQEVPAPTGGITLDLSKGAILDLTKRNPGLTKCILAAGWDAAAAGANGIDLDISAFLLNANGKISSAEDIIYFNHKEVPGVRLNGDNRTGDGDGDDETIDIDLTAVPAQYQSIAFVVNIFDAMTRRQTFGMVNSSYVRLLDSANGDKEICRFRLKDDYASSTGVIFAKLKRNGSDWEFEAVGEGKVVADLNAIAALFM